MSKIIKKAINSVNEGYALNYEVFSTKFFHEGTDYNAYGIVLEKKDRRGKILSMKMVRNITTVEKTAYEFLSLITRNFVTPEMLDDIIEDFLA